ncbi:hypothetical protein IJJ54_01265 [Candidatus Saccharibacteria bacterium]|nr:hypothetical protein [Candidatus Saccharibacteria bacterium]
MSANAADVSGGEPSREKQNSNSEQVVFDSKNIGKKPKAEYFVKVEGAEARKKAAIKAAEKKRDEARRSQKKAAFKQRIKAIPKKYIILGAVVLVVLAAMAVVAAIRIPVSIQRSKNTKTNERINESSISIREELSSRKLGEDGSYEKAFSWGEEQIAATDDPHKKYDYLLNLAQLATEDENYYNKAIEYVLEAEKFAQDPPEFYDVYMTAATTYNFMGDYEKFEQYRGKAMEYEERSQDNSEGWL